MQVWRLIAHHEAPAYGQDAAGAVDWTLRSRRIAIGWGLIGDLATAGFHSAADIKSAIRLAYPGLGNAHNGGASLWSFLNMAVGDLVIVRGKGATPLVVEVAGPYQYSQNTPFNGDHYNHQRAVNPTQLDPNAIWRAHPRELGQSVYSTLVLCKP
jgi:hypothetical protein